MRVSFLDSYVVGDVEGDKKHYEIDIVVDIIDNKILKISIKKWIGIVIKYKIISCRFILYGI